MCIFMQYNLATLEFNLAYLKASYTVANLFKDKMSAGPIQYVYHH
jgi:hypothetical protein